MFENIVKQAEQGAWIEVMQSIQSLSLGVKDASLYILAKILWQEKKYYLLSTLCEKTNIGAYKLTGESPDSLLQMLVLENKPGADRLARIWSRRYTELIKPQQIVRALLDSPTYCRLFRAMQWAEKYQLSAELKEIQQVLLPIRKRILVSLIQNFKQGKKYACDELNDWQLADGTLLRDHLWLSPVEWLEGHGAISVCDEDNFEMTGEIEGEWVLQYGNLLFAEVTRFLPQRMYVKAAGLRRPAGVSLINRGVHLPNDIKVGSELAVQISDYEAEQGYTLEPVALEKLVNW